MNNEDWFFLFGEAYAEKASTIVEHLNQMMNVVVNKCILYLLYIHSEKRIITVIHKRLTIKCLRLILESRCNPSAGYAIRIFEIKFCESLLGAL